MKYQIKSIVWIRKTPAINSFNYFGKYKVGRIVDVIDTIVDDKNRLWGRISPPDASGHSLYFCIKSYSRTYAERLDPPSDNKSLSAVIELLQEAISLLKD